MPEQTAGSAVVKGYVLADGKYVSSSYLERFATKSDESRQLPADQFASSYGSGLIEPIYNPEALTKLLEMNTYHMRAVRTKARDTAGLGWSLRATTDNPSQAEFDRAKRFLEDECHPELSFEEILERSMVDYEANGSGAIEVMRTSPKTPITGLAHCPSHTVRLHKDRVRLAQIRDGKKVWFKRFGAQVDVNYKTGDLHPLGALSVKQRATELIWFINYSSRSDYYGVPDVLPATGAILGDVSRRDYNIKFFDGHAIPAYAVVVTGADLDETTEAAIHNFFHTKVKENPHGTLVLTIPNAKGQEVKIEFHKLNVDVKDASFRLYRQDNRDEVLAAHAVPPYRAGIAETGSLGGSTAKESTEIYKAGVVQPRQEMLERRINRFILRQGLGVLTWGFKFNEIDTSDEAHDRAQHQAYFDMGVLSPNDISERVYGHRVPGIPELDQYYIKGHPVGTTPDTVEAVKSLHRELLTVVKRYAEADSGEATGRPGGQLVG